MPLVKIAWWENSKAVQKHPIMIMATWMTYVVTKKNRMKHCHYTTNSVRKSSHWKKSSGRISSNENWIFSKEKLWMWWWYTTTTRLFAQFYYYAVFSNFMLVHCNNSSSNIIINSRRQPSGRFFFTIPYCELLLLTIIVQCCHWEINKAVTCH